MIKPLMETMTLVARTLAATCAKAQTGTKERGGHVNAA